MKRDEISIGQYLVYYPPPADKDDNRHFPAQVEAIGKLVKVRLRGEGVDGKTRWVAARRLIDQPELGGGLI